MAKLHLITGLSFSIIFLMTGVYMGVSFPDLYAGREEVRMMYRATHIYILMASLINIMAANYLFYHSGTNCNTLRKISSLLIVAAPPLFFIAFIIEPPAYFLVRPFTWAGLLSLVFGVFAHRIVNLKRFTHKQ